MAFASPPAANVVFDLLDETSDVGKFVLHVASTALVADVKTAAGGLVPLLQAISDCIVLGYSITYPVKENAPVPPAPDSRVENKGLFLFNTANSRTSLIQVPGIKPDLVLPSGVIDVENSDVTDFLAAVISGTSLFRAADGSDLASLRAAYQRFRSTTKKQLPSGRSVFGT
jgi:hypothetical protein